MDFGSAMSQIAVEGGRAQIAGVEQQQRVANLENTQARTQMHQMQALAMKQEMQDRQDTAADFKSGMASVTGGIKTSADIIKGATATMTIAAQKGHFTEVKAMEELIRGAETDIKNQQNNVAQEQQAKAENTGRAAIAYQDNPTPAAAAALVRQAIDAGVPVDQIPPSTDKPAFDRWVKSLPDKARTVEKTMEAKAAADKAEQERKEKAREADNREQTRLVQIQANAEARRQADATRQLAIATASADRARAEEARAALRQQTNASARGTVGKHEGAIADLVIRNASQGVRVIDNMLSVPGSAVQSLFTKISDGTLSGSLIKAGGNWMTSEADQAVTAIGAEMGLVVGQVVTAGAGRGAALPIVESFQKMTTPQAGDSDMMKMLRISNAAEILRLELKNIVPGGTAELEESRQQMQDFLGKLPTTKQVLKAMSNLPAGEREATMGQYMQMLKASTDLTGKGKEVAAAEAKASSKSDDGWSIKPKAQ